MSIDIIGGGVAGITVETDPTALKLTGGAITGDLTVSQKVGIGGVVPIGSTNKLAVHDGNIVFSVGYGIAFGDGTTLTTAPTGGGGSETDPLALKIANNLSDILNTGTARTNLGLGTMATATASDYSTKTVADGLYYPLSGNPSGFLTTAPVTSVAGRTGVITLSNTDISGLGTMATASASNYSTKTVADGLYYPLSGNPSGFLTTAPVTSVAGRTGVITLSNTDISGLGTLAVVNDAPSDGSEYVRKNAAWSVVTGGGSSFITSVTSPLAVASGNLTVDLSAKADLAGATFTGSVSATGLTASNGNIVASIGSIQAPTGSVSARRFVGTPNAGTSALNIGTGGTETASTTAGDIWLPTGGTTINYRDGNGTWRNLLSNNVPASITVNNTNPALRITQTGLGHALLVEDSTNPDSTSFVITDLGRVGIGVNPFLYASTYSLNVNGSSVFNGAVDLTTQTVQTHTNAFTTYSNEIRININGVDRWIPFR